MTRTITVLALMGVLVLVGLNISESSYDKGFKSGMGASNCAPIVVYRRGVDTHSPEELRRIANGRARMAKVK